ncbi:unnamed protein product [Mytilus coruscus]|uniref:Ig-like domain-containing protein n=1 Tax=Mytilus coruscus TaxID=42192 RepID=A0A6J8BXT0_MYTCO|nr:unnamed protein product [Mytilus coruscus]
MNMMKVFLIGIHGYLYLQILSFVSGGLLKPKIFFDKYPFVGERIHFKCNLGKERNNSYTYFYGDRHDRHNFLDVTHSDKGRNGLVFCQSTNRNGDVSEFSNVLTLDPHYGPEDVQISPTGNVYNVTEHDKLSLVCSAKCYPGCDFFWTYKQGQTAGRNLIIENLKRLEGGLYRCHANHTEVTTKTKSHDITINVLYSPTFSVYIKFSVNYTTSWSYTFTEGKLSLIVIIESNPTSSIRMYSSDFYTQIAAQCSSNGNYYSIGVSYMSCEKTGNYTLVASNGIGRSSYRTVQLTIQCKPKETILLRNETHTELGKEWVVQLSVVSNPKPNVTWANKTSFLWEIIKMDDFRFNFTSVLKADQLSDYGIYEIKICNTIGCITEYVVLKQKEKINYLVYAVSGGVAVLFFIYLATCWLCCRYKQQKSKATNPQTKNIPENHDHENSEHLYDDNIIPPSYFPNVHYVNSGHEDTNAFTNLGYVDLQHLKQEMANRKNKYDPLPRNYVNKKY